MSIFPLRKPFLWFFLGLVGALTLLASFRGVHAQVAWVPEAGDRLIVDVTINEASLVHPDGTMFSFPVITGQRRYVRYLVGTYFAGTPIDHFTAREKNIQHDRITYGPSGHFLRLYRDGQPTHYGIHGHRDEKIMFGREDRYQSMGCIIVTDDMMSLLENIFDMNGGSLDVETVG